MANNSNIINKLNHWVGVVLGHTVLGVQEVAQVTEHATLKGTNRMKEMLWPIQTYWGLPIKKSRSHLKALRPMSRSLGMNLIGIMVLKADLSRHIVKMIWNSTWYKRDGILVHLFFPYANYKLARRLAQIWAITSLSNHFIMVHVRNKGRQSVALNVFSF